MVAGLQSPRALCCSLGVWFWTKASKILGCKRYCPSILQFLLPSGLISADFSLPKMNFICDKDKPWSPIAFGESCLPSTCAQGFASSPCPRDLCPDQSCSQGVWKIAGIPGRPAGVQVLAPALLGEFYPSGHHTKSSKGAVGHGSGSWAPASCLGMDVLLPPGVYRRVQSRRLAGWWQYVPEVTLVASRCLAALGWRRGEAIPNCVLAMTVDGQSPCWPGTASGQLLLIVALQRPRWGTPTRHHCCARTGQCVCHCHQELWLLVLLQPLLVTQLHQHITELELCAFYCIIPAGPHHIPGPAMEWKGAGLAEAINPSCEGWSGRAPYLLRSPWPCPTEQVLLFH